MNSRQRVLAAVNHEVPDRLPIDLGVHFSTGISVFAYYNLRKHLGLSTDNVELIDCSQLLARVDNDIIEKFNVDTMLLNPPYKKTHRWYPREDYVFNVPEGFDPILQQNGGYIIEKNGAKTYMPAGGYFFDGAWFNYYDYKDDDERFAEFSKRAEYIYKETDKFTMMMGFWAFFGDIEFAIRMLTEPDSVISQLQNHYDWQIGYFDRVNRAFGKYINAIEINADMGMQSGLMCTPDSYRDICYPFLKKFCSHVHNTSDIKIFLHSCGSIIDALDYITDAGVDILNPVQISAHKMDPVVLKKKYGKKICFWGGGCDTQEMLWAGTAEQVYEHTKKNVATFAPGGGFVFNQVHNIMGNVPPENIVAMLCAAQDYRY